MSILAVAGNFLNVVFLIGLRSMLRGVAWVLARHKPCWPFTFATSFHASSPLVRWTFCMRWATCWATGWRSRPWGGVFYVAAFLLIPMPTLRAESSRSLEKLDSRLDSLRRRHS